MRNSRKVLERVTRQTKRADDRVRGRGRNWRLKEKAAAAERALAENEIPSAIFAIHPLAKERYLSAINNLSKDLGNIADPSSTAAVIAVREFINEFRIEARGTVTATVFGHLDVLLAPKLSESDGSVRLFLSLSDAPLLKITI